MGDSRGDRAESVTRGCDISPKADKFLLFVFSKRIYCDVPSSFRPFTFVNQGKQFHLLLMKH